METRYKLDFFPKGIEKSVKELRMCYKNWIENQVKHFNNNVVPRLKKKGNIKEFEKLSEEICILYNNTYLISTDMKKPLELKKKVLRRTSRPIIWSCIPENFLQNAICSRF